jgi:hypothetical protein
MRKIKLAGIYKILHKPSKQYYIGMSVDIFGRWSGHYTDIKMTRHSSPRFMELWNNTDPTEWQFSIIENVSITVFKIESKLKGKGLVSGFRKHLLEKERYWMSKHKLSLALNADCKWFKIA